MIPFIESGIPGFDELTKSDNGIGGIPENTATLVYGPAKTGKTIFSNQFTYKGLLNGEPCLYISTDYGAKQLEINMNDFQLPVEKYLDDESLYIIDTISDISSENPIRSKSIIPSYINNPTDIMVKVGSGIHFVCKNNPRFRSVLNSSTTLLAYNDNKLIIRVLKAYLMRIYEAGGTSIITYTEDSADRIVETMLKSIVDNIIRLDANELTVEAMKGVGKKISPYKITEKGIVI